MRRIIWTGTLLLAALALPTQVSTQQHSATAHSGGSGGHAMAARYGDLKWQPILNAFSAAHLRKLPQTRVHVTVTAQSGTGEGTLAEYTLEHGGSFERR